MGTGPRRENLPAPLHRPPARRSPRGDPASTALEALSVPSVASAVGPGWCSRLAGSGGSGRGAASDQPGAVGGRAQPQQRG
eukprot:jgi/Mesen1/9226/ME000595S08641